MSDLRETPVCRQHNLSAETKSDFGAGLLDFWEVFAREINERFSNQNYSDEGWRRSLSRLLAKHFGYRGGNITYFRRRKKAQDTLVAPTWLYLPSDRSISDEKFRLVRNFFQEGVADEVKLPYRETQAGVLALPRPTIFEKEHDCVFMSDGEVSYRCLQYLWKTCRPLIETDEEYLLLLHWMDSLGLLSNGSSTVRLLRMLAWLRSAIPVTFGGEVIERCLAEVCSALGINGIENEGDGEFEVPEPHAGVPLGGESLSGLVSCLLTQLTADAKTAFPIGVNTLGHLILRCVSAFETHGIPALERINKYLEGVDPNLLDKTCIDRSIIALPISIMGSEESFLPVYYFGSHVGLSPSILRSSVADNSPPFFYSPLSLCVSGISGKLLPSRMALDESEMRGREVASTIAHDVARSLYEALALTETAGTYLSLASRASTEISGLIINNIVQRRLLVGMFADPWLRRQEKHEKVRITWNKDAPKISDATYWSLLIAYQAAAILYANFHALNKETFKLRTTSRDKINRALDTLRKVTIRYSFISEQPLQMTLTEEIVADHQYLYQLLRRLEKVESAKFPWPVTSDRSRDLMSYEGQQAAILWPAREMLRNAVNYALTSVSQGQLPVSEGVIDLLVNFSPEQRKLVFRVENFLLPILHGIDKQLDIPTTLAHVEDLMPDTEVKNLSTAEKAIFQVSLTFKHT
jgi:hypothetical protein